MKRNYRVCYRPSQSPTHHIHEVYYDQQDRVILYGREPAVAFGDDKDELYECCAEMWKAFDDEPLDLDRMDKKIFIRMINEEFNDVYDKHSRDKDKK
jgi:hypothetical protein